MYLFGLCLIVRTVLLAAEIENKLFLNTSLTDFNKYLQCIVMTVEDIC